MGFLLKFVMPGLVPGIHVLRSRKKNVDGRDKPGHDEETFSRQRDAHKKIPAATRPGGCDRIFSYCY
jgi:hypothetical protein